MLTTTRPRWVWRCHIDLSEPNPDVLDFLLPSISSYDASIFHMHEYVPSRGRARRGAVIWPPAIDPLAPKNMALAPEDAAYIVDQFGIDAEPADDAAGLALRPLEGPAGRDRGLPRA